MSADNDNCDACGGNGILQDGDPCPWCSGALDMSPLPHCRTFIEPCGQREGTDGCWYCGRRKAEHAFMPPDLDDVQQRIPLTPKDIERESLAADLLRAYFDSATTDYPDVLTAHQKDFRNNQPVLVLPLKEKRHHQGDAQHLYGERGFGPSLCGNEDRVSPCNALSPAEFREQLGSATGRNVTFFIEDPPAICALCATKYIEEQRNG